MQLLDEVGFSNDKSEAYLIKSQIYDAKGDYKSSLIYYKLYSSMKDSVSQKANLEQIAKLQLNYDLEQKEVELQKERALNATLEMHKGRVKSIGDNTKAFTRDTLYISEVENLVEIERICRARIQENESKYE